MHVTHYLLLGFFAGPAPAPAANGTGGARRIPRKGGRQSQGFGFVPDLSLAQQARRRRRQQDDFITLHLLTH